MFRENRVLVFILLLNINNSLWCEKIEIKVIELHRIKEVKRMISGCILELLQLNLPTKIFEIIMIYMSNEFEDLNNIKSSYLGNKGIFYMAVDDNKIIGTGAIRKLDNEICELKRMWFLKQYRGRGFGLAMANKLLEFAKTQGYKRVRLDVYYPDMQARAITFYKKLGFYEISSYNNSSAKLFMEKIL